MAYSQQSHGIFTIVFLDQGMSHGILAIVCLDQGMSRGIFTKSVPESMDGTWHIHNIVFWFCLMLNVPVNNFSVMLGRSHCFLGITSTFGGGGGGGGGGG